SHGYGTAIPDPVARLRAFRGAGGRIWVLDPRRTETAAVADGHLALLPGTDHLVLAWLARELLVAGADRQELDRHCARDEIEALRKALAPFTLEAVAAAADVEGARLAALLADVRAAPGRLAVLCGTGVTMSRDGLVACWLRWVLLILTGSLDRPGGMRCNRGLLFGTRGRADGPPAGPGPASRPELRHWAGQFPCVAMADEIEAGNLRALIVAGGNPLTAFPDAARVRAALARLDALAVLDVMETGLGELATHVLPATGQLERADVLIQESICLRPGTQYTPPVVRGVGERRPSWWIFAQLARRLAPVLASDFDVLDGLDPDAVDDETLVRRLATARGVDAERLIASRWLEAPPEYGWVHAELLRDGRFRIAPAEILARLRPPARDRPALVLTPRRHLRSMNSAHYAHARSASPPRVLLHPESARDAGLGDAETASVKTAHGELRATVSLDPSVRPGVVSIVHGWQASNVGGLTSSRAGVDALTGMPETSGVAVALDRADAGAQRVSPDAHPPRS
ncbi:MAG TPA: molybdopterin-dependent oxidoreductase, partial [Candidatus Bathyarchaeia archaeon]|nr:molybdopterin-dependent oxidoreductase [Candidatus Bathyarchaeia archaeon]